MKFSDTALAFRLALLLPSLLALVAPDSTAAPFPVGTLRGTVKEQGSGAPVAGVRVRFYDQNVSERGSAVTDAEGRFVSSSLVGGSYYLFVDRSGEFAPQLYDGLPCIRRSYDRFTCDLAAATRVSPTNTNAEIPITVRRGATFSGTVRDRVSGAPMPGATVALLGEDLTDLEIYGEADAEGRFTLQGIPPGEYYLEASQASYPLELWPGATCLRDCDEERLLATRIEVKDAERHDGLDFRLGAFAALRGTVRDRQTGLPIRGASLRLHRAEPVGQIFGAGQTDADGRYAKERVPPLAFYVEAAAFGYQAQVHRGIGLEAWQADPSSGEKVELTPGGLATVDFALAPQPAIRVRVVQPSGGQSCRLSVYSRLADGSASLVDTFHCDDGNEIQVLVPGPGQYLLAARGDFAPMLLGAGSCYFDDYANYCDFTRATPIAVGADEAVGPIELRPEAAAILRASARDAATAAPAPAIFVLADPTGRRLFQNDGSQGATSFEKLPPGRYYLAALGVPGHQNEVYPGLPCGRFYCDPLAGQPIELAPGADIAAAFELEALTTHSCDEKATRLCVQQDRFEIAVSWRDYLGAEGEAQLVPLGAESGYSLFFSPSNVELMVKVLNGCSPQLGKHFWVIAAGLTDVAVRLEVKDTWTGLQRVYENPLGTRFPPIFDLAAFATCDAPEPAGAPAPAVQAITAAAAPVAAAAAAEESMPVFCSSPPNCIANRFRPAVLFTPPQGGTGTGLPSTLTSETKAYSFFSADNYEVLIKVLDACASTGHYWFFAAGLTDLPVTILLADRATLHNYTFESPGGRPFEPIFDYTTLSCDY